mmetsp:Transcript_10507/g.17808  ORF Transcript_10507/g.17808 Transcript_10507/m.17808 type:complete len:213 (+) Transcript_10507:480-1118(+)
MEEGRFARTSFMKRATSARSVPGPCRNEQGLPTTSPCVNPQSSSHAALACTTAKGAAALVTMRASSDAQVAISSVCATTGSRRRRSAGLAPSPFAANPPPRCSSFSSPSSPFVSSTRKSSSLLLPSMLAAVGEGCGGGVSGDDAHCSCCMNDMTSNTNSQLSTLFWSVKVQHSIPGTLHSHSAPPATALRVPSTHRAMAWSPSWCTAPGGTS